MMLWRTVKEVSKRSVSLREAVIVDHPDGKALRKRFK